jgi:hypothetical protein
LDAFELAVHSSCALGVENRANQRAEVQKARCSTLLVGVDQVLDTLGHFGKDRGFGSRLLQWFDQLLEPKITGRNQTASDREASNFAVDFVENRNAHVLSLEDQAN